VLSERGASNPGRLRLRLTLEKPTHVPDGAGGATVQWDAAAIVAADVMSVSADERPAGEGLADLVTHRIVIRHRDDVSGGDRFRLGARVFRIRGVRDPAEDGRYLVCLAEEEGGA
jgi:SPP1 family predicted phage head-tail adaptor